MSCKKDWLQKTVKKFNISLIITTHISREKIDMDGIEYFDDFKKLYDISHISKNPMNGRTDWVDVIYVNSRVR